MAVVGAMDAAYCNEVTTFLTGVLSLHLRVEDGDSEKQFADGCKFAAVTCFSSGHFESKLTIDA